MHVWLLVNLECGSTMTTPLLITTMIEWKGETPLKYLVIIKTNSDPQLLGIHSMVDATPPVLLCGLFPVLSKHSNRALTLIQHSCMSSCHIAICYSKKTKQTIMLQIINLKKGVGIQAIKSCETNYLHVKDWHIHDY